MVTHIHTYISFDLTPETNSPDVLIINYYQIHLMVCRLSSIYSMEWRIRTCVGRVNRYLSIAINSPLCCDWHVSENVYFQLTERQSTYCL